ncbi:EF-P lysine aminoacylase GenX [Patescibacteria group bacterium]|nr:EF-P lysine aminoacylase GenX [Patescibacteria group bacterium]
MNIEALRTRSLIVKAIRRYFDDQAFVEMHTPRLVGLPGQEPYLEPLWTTIEEQRGTKHRAALITSPEYAMKRALAAGFERIYDLGPCFRNNEPWDGSHDPEFLMIEWYRRDAGLEELIVDTQGMIRFAIAAIPGSDAQVALAEACLEPFRVLTVKEAMKLYAAVDLDPLLENREAMAEVVRLHNQTVTSTDSWDDLFFKIFLSEVEPHLGWNTHHTAFQPTFLTHYPASMAALARKDQADPRYALRTELYIGDLELANGFAELSDEVEQRARFLEEQDLRRSLGKEVWPLDERFLQALPAMGDAAGIAFGVERLVMLLVGTNSISEILPIPVQERFSV